jgi:hypothetical protein
MADFEGSRNGEQDPVEKGPRNSRTIAVVVGAALALIVAALVVVRIAGDSDEKSSVPKPDFSKKHGFYSAPLSL